MKLPEHTKKELLSEFIINLSCDWSAGLRWMTSVNSDLNAQKSTAINITDVE